jgi:hypothetical protein
VDDPVGLPAHYGDLVSERARRYLSLALETPSRLLTGSIGARPPVPLGVMMCWPLMSKDFSVTIPPKVSEVL